MLHVLEIANLLFFAAILLGHLACDLLLKCKKCKKLNLSDIVFSTAAFPNMPNGLPWNLDYKPEKGDITGFNIVNNDLKNTNWKDKKSWKILSKKRAPKTMKDFAKLNKPEQSHILSRFLESGDVSYPFSEHSLNILNMKHNHFCCLKATDGSISAKTGLISLLVSNCHSGSANYQVIGFGAGGASAAFRPSPITW